MDGCVQVPNWQPGDIIAPAGANKRPGKAKVRIVTLPWSWQAHKFMEDTGLEDCQVGCVGLSDRPAHRVHSIRGCSGYCGVIQLGLVKHPQFQRVMTDICNHLWQQLVQRKLPAADLALWCNKGKHRSVGMARLCTWCIQSCGQETHEEHCSCAFLELTCRCELGGHSPCPAVMRELQRLRAPDVEQRARAVALLQASQSQQAYAEALPIVRGLLQERGLLEGS